ncbi:MAG TPA: hypothetical protein DCP63_15715, partial [Bacteroidetes bacterium]|nr:hypothetical protein [Bacteroidota bacterium]
MFVKRRGLKYKFILGSIAAIVVATALTTTLLLILVDSSPQHIIIYLLFASVFYVLIGSTLILFLSKIMVQPVISLTEKVHEVRNGNFDISIENKSSGDEMGELFEGFNAMVKDLKTSISDLRAEKEKAELYSRQLYDSKAKLEAIFNGISDGIMVINRDFRIIAVNPFFEKIMGHPPPELVGHHCYEMCHDGGYLCQGCNAIATFESGRYLSSMRTVADKAGEKRYFDVHNFPLRNEKGEVQQVIEYVKEVTGVIRAREKLEQSRRLAELGELAAKVAHEVRNPLHAIEGAAHYLLNEFQTNNIITTFGTLIRDQVARLNKVTSDLLNYAKPMTADLAPGQVVPIIQRSLDIVKHHLEAKGINVRFSYPHELPLILIDGRQLEQAIINLVVNAADAMSYCGQLVVEVKTLESPSNGIDEGIQIAVADDGCGMDDQVRKMMFSPFFTTKEKGKGTGLGLSTVYGIV